MKSASENRSFNETIDFTKTVQLYYDKMNEMLNASPELMHQMKEGNIDIRVNYRTQSELPKKIVGSSLDNLVKIQPQLGKKRKADEGADELEDRERE